MDVALLASPQVPHTHNGLMDLIVNLDLLGGAVWYKKYKYDDVYRLCVDEINHFLL